MVLFCINFVEILMFNNMVSEQEILVLVLLNLLLLINIVSEAEELDLRIWMSREKR